MTPLEKEVFPLNNSKSTNSEDSTQLKKRAIIKTINITKRFGGLVAVDSVSISIDEGEIRCIIGPNGAGKSTFAQLVCGTCIPDSGKIILDDKDITKFQTYQRIQLGIGLKFQTNRAYHNLTVSHNLEVPLRNVKKRKRMSSLNHYNIALRSFKLIDKKDIVAKELAHHQLQWLEICMALATGPRVLFLDEPTAGMSPEETHFTAEVVKQLNKDGLSIVVVEHDMAFVREIAQRVTVFHQGKIFSEGSIDEISSNEDVKQIYLGKK